MRGRFAPSPTGPLHLGGARTALVAWLSCRTAGGRLVVRMEDLDSERARAGSGDAILADLDWLGLDWDEGPLAQSARGDRYRAAIERLRADGHLYECFCTRAELARAASAPHAGEAGPIYPGTCAALPPAEVARRLLAGQRAALRLRCPPGLVSFVDLVRGPVSQDVAREVGDFAVVRADGVPAYQLAVAVDDAEMAITEVVRGDDLLDSTPRQLLVMHLLRLTAPSYAHLPLVLTAGGVRLAKRDGGAQIASLRGEGRAASEIVGWLGATLGLCPPGTRAMPDALVAAFAARGFASLAGPPTRIAAGKDPLAR